MIGVLAALIFPAVQGAREAARRMQRQANLHRLGLALQNYQSTNNVYPFGVGADFDGILAQKTRAKSRRYSLLSQVLSYD